MFPCMRLKHLQAELEAVGGFETPKALLEQYVTPPHLSSHMLYTIQSQFGDVAGKLVADLGCGCGALTVGAAVLDAAFVTSFDIDLDALTIFQENTEGLPNVEAVLCDIRTVSSLYPQVFDTVIMNPPFGTKLEGIDMEFLKAGVALATGAVYSLHKSSTRKHVLKAAEALGVTGEVLAQLRYDLPATYKFHKRKSVDIEVDFYRFVRKGGPRC